MDAEAPRILIVEDDADLMRLMVHTLSAAGFRVVQAYGGEDALRKARLHVPALIVTDLAMPKMSGVEVIARVKSDPEISHIPCIAVTAYTWENLGIAAKSVGCDAFLSKPFTPLRLRQEVARCLAAAAASRPRRSVSG